MGLSVLVSAANSDGGGGGGCSPDFLARRFWGGLVVASSIVQPRLSLLDRVCRQMLFSSASRAMASLALSFWRLAADLLAALLRASSKGVASILSSLQPLLRRHRIVSRLSPLFAASVSKYSLVMRIVIPLECAEF